MGLNVALTPATWAGIVALSLTVIFIIGAASILLAVMGNNKSRTDNGSAKHNDALIPGQVDMKERKGDPINATTALGVILSIRDNNATVFDVAGMTSSIYMWPQTVDSEEETIAFTNLQAPVMLPPTNNSGRTIFNLVNDQPTSVYQLRCNYDKQTRIVGIDDKSHVLCFLVDTVHNNYKLMQLSPLYRFQIDQSIDSTSSWTNIINVHSPQEDFEVQMEPDRRYRIFAFTATVP